MTLRKVRGEYAFQDLLGRSFPALGQSEELELARRVRDRSDWQAAERLARAHLRHVVFLAASHRRYGLPVSELVAEGNFGLFEALRRFDPERGVRFGTYAKHWIRAYIFAHVIHSQRSVGGKSGIVSSRLFFRLRRERARMVSLFGEGDAMDAALAQRLSVSVPRLRDLLVRLDCREISLDGPAAPNSATRAPDSLITSRDPEQAYWGQQRGRALRAAVSSALAGLDARERFIVERRLMAAPEEELTLAQVAANIGVSRERVRQLEKRAKRKLTKSAAIRASLGLRAPAL